MLYHSSQDSEIMKESWDSFYPPMLQKTLSDFSAIH